MFKHSFDFCSHFYESDHRFYATQLKWRLCRGFVTSEQIASSGYVTVPCNIAMPWTDESRHPENWTIHQRLYVPQSAPPPSSTQCINIPNLNHMLHSRTLITKARRWQLRVSVIFRWTPAFLPPSLSARPGETWRTRRIVSGCNQDWGHEGRNVA